MSSQLKYKFKKTLKKAEFTHADLEYHEQVAPEIKNSFSEKITELVTALPPETRERLSKHHKTKNSVPPEKTTPDEESPEALEEPSAPKTPDEVKKLFRKIAAVTHPDKVEIKNISAKEKEKLTDIFKRAREAFDQEDWYVLQGIALDLDIEIPNPSEKQIEWMETSIASIEKKIAHIQNLTAWHWYHGDDFQKTMAVLYYFKHHYDFDYPFKE